MLDYLNAEIEKRQNEIAKIEAERHKLDQRRHDLGIELRTYEDIRARLARGGDQQKAEAGREPPSATLVGTSTTMSGSTRSKLAAHWQVVLRAAVERYPAVVKNSEVGTIQRSAGYNPARSMNIRTHLHKLREEGLLEELVDRGAVGTTQGRGRAAWYALGNEYRPETEYGGVWSDRRCRERNGGTCPRSQSRRFHLSQPRRPKWNRLG